MILLREKSQIKYIIKEKHAYQTKKSTEDKGHYFTYFLIPPFLMGFSECSFLVDE